jgi:hypothetical protein
MFVFQNNWSFSQKKIVARRTCFLVDFFVKTIKNGSFLGESRIYDPNLPQNLRLWEYKNHGKPLMLFENFA